MSALLHVHPSGNSQFESTPAQRSGNFLFGYEDRCNGLQSTLIMVLKKKNIRDVEYDKNKDNFYD